MTKQERFIVSIDNKNGVGLYDGDIRLLYFQFNNIQDATECKDALKHQCSLMNELHEENERLKASKEYWKSECLSNSSLNQIELIKKELNKND